MLRTGFWDVFACLDSRFVDEDIQTWLDVGERRVGGCVDWHACCGQ